MITALGLIITVWLLMVAITNPEQLWLILVLSGLVGLSDLLDGWIARRLKIESSIGGVLDRLRDKIFICPILIILVWPWHWSTIESGILTFTKALIVLIILIEFFLILMGIVGLVKRLDVRANPFGKRKMFCQFVAVYLWLLSLVAERYLGLSPAHLSIYLIDLILCAVIYLGLKSFEGYWERYR